MKNALLGIVAIIAVVAGVVALTEYKKASKAEIQNSALQGRIADADAKASTLEQQLKSSQAEIASLKEQTDEVHRLRGEVSSLNKIKAALEERNQKIVARLERQNSPPPPAPAPPSPDQVLPAQFATFEDMTRTVASLRNKAFQGKLTEAERTYLKQLEPQLQQLQKSPTEFAAFQSSMIQSATGIDDPARLEQIRTVIERTYQNATQRGLAIPDASVENPAWEQQRTQLDRRATSAVQKILTDAERSSFDQVFKGVMGVDLGLEPSTPRQ